MTSDDQVDPCFFDADYSVAVSTGSLMYSLCRCTGRCTSAQFLGPSADRRRPAVLPAVLRVQPPAAKCSSDVLHARVKPSVSLSDK